MNVSYHESITFGFNSIAMVGILPPILFVKSACITAYLNNNWTTARRNDDLVDFRRIWRYLSPGGIIFPSLGTGLSGSIIMERSDMNFAGRKTSWPGSIWIFFSDRIGLFKLIISCSFKIELIKKRRLTSKAYALLPWGTYNNMSFIFKAFFNFCFFWFERNFFAAVCFYYS